MTKNIYFILPLIMIGCNNLSSIDVDLSNSLIIPNKYSINYTKNKLEIDGKDDELDWDKALKTNDFIDIANNQKPLQKTYMKMLWDDKNLYIYARLYEKHIWGNITERDAVIFKNNDFEVFLKPSTYYSNYGELEINALGTVWDLLLDKPYRLGGKANTKWNINNLKSSVYISGTLNKSNDEDNFWSCEISIPLNEILKINGNNFDNVKAGDMWRANFSRVQWEHDLIDGNYSRKKEEGKLKREYNWVWSRQGQINMHIPENWGFIYFNAENEINKNFNLKIDLKTEQYGYALFEKIKYKELKYLNDLDVNSRVQFNSESLEKNNINAEFIKTKDGFFIKCKNQIDDFIYKINQNGIIKYEF